MPKKLMQGIVISNKMQKTVVVSVEKIKVHPVYKKRFRRHKKYKVHDEIGASEGDVVVIEEHRPLSKEKKWIVKEVMIKKKRQQKGENS